MMPEEWKSAHGCWWVPDRKSGWRTPTPGECYLRISVLMGEIVRLKSERQAAKEDAERLAQALAGLEVANDVLASMRPQKVYDLLIEADQEDQLSRLDDARQSARASLAAHDALAIEGEGPILLADADALRAKLQELEERHAARVTELLEANNREVERRRKAEERASDDMASITGLKEALKGILGHDGGPGSIDYDSSLYRRARLAGKIALADSTLQWNPTHRHRKGGLYRVIVRGHMEADYPASPVVVYDDANGRVFARPADEFDDGRFTEVSHG